MKDTESVNSSNVPQELRLNEGHLLELFKKIDINNDGHICNYDLSKSLENYLPLYKSKVYNTQFIHHWMKNGATSEASQQLTFKQFSDLMMQHEEKLWDAFNDLDLNKDGVLDENDLWHGFKKFGIHIELNEARKLIESLERFESSRSSSCYFAISPRMYMMCSSPTDSGMLQRRRMSYKGSRHITFPQWRSYWTLHPNPTIHNMLPDWRCVVYVDVGEDISLPDDFTDTEMQEGMWWRHLVSGGVAGAVSRTFTAPLDRTKVFFQVHSSRFPTIISCVRHMLDEGGVRSMWRGNGINVFKIAPETAIKFSAYEKIKRLLRSDQEVRLTDRFLAGSLAGAFSQSMVYPLEVLKTRLSLRRTGEFSGIADAIVKIFRKEGPHSFYRGYLPNLIGVFPYAGIDLAIYETLKNMYISHHKIEDQNPGVLVVLACAMTSSTCGQLASYPLSLIKTRLQASSHKMSMVKMFQDTVKHEGVRGLYRGFWPNFLKVAPSVSISYIVYEKCRHHLGAKMS